MYPERDFTQREYRMFDMIRERVEAGFYAKRKELEETARRLSDDAAAANMARDNNPRYAELCELLYNGPDEARRELANRDLAAFTAMNLELDAMANPVFNAERAAAVASGAVADIETDLHIATEMFFYIAGQREGLRLGIQLAGKLIQQEPVGLVGVTPEKAPVLVASAMTDDALADRLVDAMVRQILLASGSGAEDE